MALDKTFASGEILSAGDVNAHLLGLWAPIDKRVVPSGSPASTLTFSSLDTNFRMFRITYDCVTSVNLASIRFNNDSAANYKWQYHQAANTTINAARNESLTGITFMGAAADRNAGQWIFSKPTAAMPCIGYSINGLRTDANVDTFAGLWNNTSSLISRIDIVAIAGTFYGIVALEGMRGV